MKKIVIWFCLFLLHFYDIQAQEKFLNLYGGNSYDFGIDLIQTSDSGFILLSNTSSYSPDAKLMLIKTDKSGNEQWRHFYGNNQSEEAKFMRRTTSDFLYLAGTIHNLNNSYDYYVVKTNLEGDTIWTRNTGTNAWDILICGDTTENGGIILGGISYLNDPLQGDFYFTILNSAGTATHQFFVNDTGLIDIAGIKTISNGYLVCGTAVRDTSTGRKNDIVVLKLDVNGQVMWKKYFGGNEDDKGFGIIKSKSGKYLLFGQTKSFGVATDHNNCYIAKIDESGNFLNQQQITGFAEEATPLCLAEGLDSLVTLSGWYAGGPEREIFIFQFTSTLNFYNGTTYGGGNHDWANSIVACNDTGYAAVGSSRSFMQGLENIILVKTDKTLMGSNAQMNFYVPVKEEEKSTVFKYYPNPVEDFLYIQSDIKSIKEISVYSFDGKLCVNFINPKESGAFYTCSLPLSELDNGIYFVKIFSQNGDSRMIKIVKN